MLILGLLGMYFDAAVVFFTSQTLLLKLAVAILWKPWLKHTHLAKLESLQISKCSSRTFYILIRIFAYFIIRFYYRAIK